MKKISIWLVILLAVILGGKYYLTRPVDLQGEYTAERKLYQYDTVTKNDFKVCMKDRLGNSVPVENYKISSSKVSRTGLVTISTTYPRMGTLVALDFIKVQSSKITYNEKCYEDQLEAYDPKVEEIISYEDGREEIVPEDQLDIKCQPDLKQAEYSISVEGKNDNYQVNFPMITVTSITTNSKVSTKKTLDSGELILTANYSDGSQRKIDSKLVKSDPIKKPKKGTNKLTCYYNGRKYKVKVKCYTPKAKRKTVSFQGFGKITLLYSKEYDLGDVTRLNTYMGVNYFDNHRETYYTIYEAGGRNTAYDVPGQHIAEDGTIRDEDGYICVASHFSYRRPYEVVLTSLGPGKVYDNGCPYGTLDLYVAWD